MGRRLDDRRGVAAVRSRHSGTAIVTAGEAAGNQLQSVFALGACFSRGCQTGESAQILHSMNPHSVLCMQALMATAVVGAIAHVAAIEVKSLY